MLPTVAVWLMLAEVANSMSCNIAKMEKPQLWVKASFPLNVREIVNDIIYKLMAVFTKKKGVFNYFSGTSEKFFEFTPFITKESALLLIKTKITFIIDLVLLSPFNHICFTE